MGSQDPFGYLKHKLWPKKGQTGNFTPDHGKSGIDPMSLCAGEVWHTVGKAFDEGYKFVLDLILIGGLHKKL
jgi:hypothetical protein